MLEEEKDIIIEWIIATFEEEIQPYEASTDCIKQETTYWCYGCTGDFISKWPEWEKPTDETFPHKNNCKFLMLKRYANEKNSTMGVT